jgi:hypothetical protein
MTKDQNTASKHKYYDLACNAHRNTSYSPEKRAAYECEYYDAVCKELTDAGKESAIEKFTRLFVKSLGAKARCASPMITGPARFPVARMEKYNRWERNATQAMVDFLEKVRRPPVEPRTELDYGIQEKEYMIGDVKVMQNTADNRLQLFFPSKPDEEMIQKLKSRGFKWSPRNKAWQRQLTPNALRVVPYIFADTGAA